MTRRISFLGTVFLLGTLLSFARAAEALKLDSEGYIRHWVMLAPIALRGGDSAAEAILKEQIKDEALLRPKSGDQVKVGAKDLTWEAVTTATNYLDFNATLKSINDQVVGYMVTYIECDADIPNVVMAVASNDQGRIFFNGIDIYAVTEARPLILDADKGRVTLRKGTNVIVFKIINEQNSWQGAMRLLDQAGAPLKNVRLKQSP